MASQTVNLRDLIIPSKPKWYFVDCDWAQVENRIGAILTGEKFLLDAFERGDDIYKKVYSEMYKVDIASVSKSQRQIGKKLVLGQNYDMTYVGLAEELKCSHEEAKLYVKLYQDAHPFTREAKKALLHFARKNGYVRTYYGRVRYIRNINSDNHYEKSNAEREVWNTYIQGTAADILKFSLVRLYTKIKETGSQIRIVMPVHDEILVEASGLDTDPWEVRAIMKEAMEIELKGVKLPVEAEFGWRFGSLVHTIDKLAELSPYEDVRENFMNSAYFKLPKEESAKAVIMDTVPEEADEVEEVSFSDNKDPLNMVETDFQLPAMVLTVPEGSQIPANVILQLSLYKAEIGGYCLYVLLDPKKEAYKLPNRVKLGAKLLLDSIGKVEILTGK